jgi:hypothetical protein
VHTKDPCWYVGIIYDPKELPGVSTAGPRVDGVLQLALIRAPITAMNTEGGTLCGGVDGLQPMVVRSATYRKS